MIFKLENITVRQWLNLCVFNFLIVCLFGLLMRSKLLFSVPWIDQKNIMHAHSHYAFSAWVSQLLMLFMIKSVFKLESDNSVPKIYAIILGLNQLLSIGMLICFSINGYFVGSIIFSFLVVLLSYVFSVYIFRDISKTKIPVAIKYLFNASIFFNVFSTLGTYGLIYLKATHSFDSLKQLASVYFYLHFQYNGWFMIACLGLLLLWIYQKQGRLLLSKRKALLFIITVIPTYFLSVLWWKEFPNYLFFILVLTVIFQLGIWVKLLYNIALGTSLGRVNRGFSFIWIFIAVALLVKLLLQALSVIPSLSQLAYGFRPIVIAYLHLVLLAIISLFLFAYSFAEGLLFRSKLVIRSMFFLLGAVFLNEFFLGMQGVAGIFRVSIEKTNEGLLLATLVMACSITFILIGQLKGSHKEDISENKVT